MGKSAGGNAVKWIIGAAFIGWADIVQLAYSMASTWVALAPQLLQRNRLDIAPNWELDGKLRRRTIAVTLLTFPQPRHVICALPRARCKSPKSRMFFVLIREQWRNIAVGIKGAVRPLPQGARRRPVRI